MDDLIDDLVRVARRCERGARLFEADEVDDLKTRLFDAIREVGKAWSGSWLGYQARVYTVGLQPKRPGETFDGMNQGSYSDSTAGDWLEFDAQEVTSAIYKRARLKETALEPLKESAKQAEKIFAPAQDEVLATIDAVLSSQASDPVLVECREKIAKVKSLISERLIVETRRPTQFASRDDRAIGEGLVIPPHVAVEIRLISLLSRGAALSELAKHVRYLETYLQKRHKMKGKSVAKIDGKIFIGHGGSSEWKDLRDFLRDRLDLPWDEFNREPTAGLSTKERLEAMLDDASFAFLVMTAEDEHADGGKHARSNVIHEVGLFQGRLGFTRAIVVLEEGCAEFSNIVGITQLRFKKGAIGALSEEIRRVLEREGIIR